ncbi:MAG: hypothetical protein AAF220_14210, partial [Pseudomonadota bacterium]
MTQNMPRRLWVLGEEIEELAPLASFESTIRDILMTAPSSSNVANESVALDATQVALNHEGWAAIEWQQGGIRIYLNSKRISGDSASTLLFILLDSPPIESLTIMDLASQGASHHSWADGLSTLSTLSDRRQKLTSPIAQARTLSKLSVTRHRFTEAHGLDTPFGAVCRAWSNASEALDITNAEIISPECTMFSVYNDSHDWRFEEIGAGLRPIYGDDWCNSAKGSSVLDQPDSAYAQQISLHYDTVFESVEPSFDLVEAVFDTPRGKQGLRYRRALLPNHSINVRTSNGCKIRRRPSRLTVISEVLVTDRLSS